MIDLMIVWIALVFIVIYMAYITYSINVIIESILSLNKAMGLFIEKMEEGEQISDEDLK